MWGRFIVGGLALTLVHGLASYFVAFVSGMYGNRLMGILSNILWFPLSLIAPLLPDDPESWLPQILMLLTSCLWGFGIAWLAVRRRG